MEGVPLCFEGIRRLRCVERRIRKYLRTVLHHIRIEGRYATAFDLTQIQGLIRQLLARIESKPLCRCSNRRKIDAMRLGLTQGASMQNGKLGVVPFAGNGY